MKYCPVCHKQVNETASFCHKCGYDFGMGDTSFNDENPAESDQEEPDSESFPVRELSMGDSDEVADPPRETAQSTQQYPPNINERANSEREGDQTVEDAESETLLSEAEKDAFKKKLQPDTDPKSSAEPQRQSAEPASTSSPDQPTPPPKTASPESSQQNPPPPPKSQMTQPQKQPRQKPRTSATGTATVEQETESFQQMVFSIEKMMGAITAAGLVAGGILRLTTLPSPNALVAYGTVGIMITLAIIAATVPLAELPREITSSIYGAVGFLGTAVFAISGLLLPDIASHWLLAIELSASFLAISTALFPLIAQRLEA